jgi:predicted outer membrane protein
MTRILSPLLAVLAIGSSSFGQDKRSPPQTRQPEARQDAQRPSERAQNTNQPAAQRTTGQETDRVMGPLADCLILSNQEEIALLKLAQLKSKNNDVKKFVEMAIKDHEKAISELQKFAEHQPGELEGASTRGSAGATPPNRRDVTAQKPATGQSEDHSETMFTIAQQASQECLAMTKEQLNKSDAEKFDQCFLGQQIGMHIGMSAKLKAIQNNTSGEFQQLTSKLASTAQKHKENAEKLMKDVEKK